MEYLRQAVEYAQAELIAACAMEVPRLPGTFRTWSRAGWLRSSPGTAFVGGLRRQLMIKQLANIEEK